MRIIGGQWKSRRISRPDSPATRPVPDRVKESIFNMLGNHYDCLGELPPIRVADVFAGGGSMGLEALSRGASHCAFFERDRTALSVLRKNLIALDAKQVATIISRDAWRDVATLTGDNRPDLILLDPPYSEARDVTPTGGIWKFLEGLRDSVRSGCLIVLHHPKKVDFSNVDVAAWRVMDQRTIGSNGLTVFVYEVSI